MNCTEFSQVVIDLSRKRPMDSAIQQRAFEHAARCPQCTKRLAAEQSLAATFRLWAEADSAEVAPERVEVNLKNAFSAMRERRARQRRAVLWAGGVAAAILLAVIGTRLLERGKTVAPPAVRQTHQSEPERANPVQQGHHELAMQRPQPAAQPAKKVNPVRKPAVQAATTWATEFLPLPYADNTAPIGDGEVVRVELPGSALVQVGVPLDPAQAQRRVVADVLLDEFGTARAVRFVSAPDIRLH